MTTTTAVLQKDARAHIDRLRIKSYRYRRHVGAMSAFHRDRLRRRRALAGTPTPTAAVDSTLLRHLRRDGYVIVPDAIDLALLDEIGTDLERSLDTATGLSTVWDMIEGGSGEGELARVPVDDNRLAAGQHAFRDWTASASVAQPLMVSAAAVRVAFDPTIMSVANSYLRCPPAVMGINLRKSFVNDLPAAGTLFFHRDGNSPRFVKCFAYLHDVGPGGGAFTYVRGSHRRRRELVSKKRWTDDEVAELYGSSSICELHAPAGSVIIADTTGFHRGTKPVGADRSMLSVYLGIHPEFGGAGATFDIARSTVEALDPAVRRAADFLNVIDEA